MEVQLIVLRGKHAGKKIPIPGPKFMIGRGEDCQLRPRSELVSHHHCAILIQGDKVKVEDYGSKSGTLVNGKRVEGQQELHGGDKLQVAQLEFEVSLGVSLKGQKKPKVRSVQEAAARTVESAASEEELDIISWLAPDEGGSTDTKTPDRQQVASEETAGADSAWETAQQEPTKEEAAKENDQDKPKVPGTGEKSRKKPQAPSSREAAAEALKNFFRRY